MPVTLEVWSDYACPLCYLALPELLRMQRLRGVVVMWHAFELRPDPVPLPDPDGDAVRREWARAVYPMAEARNHPLQRPAILPRSRFAAEAAEFARDAGRFGGMHRGLFEAYFRHGRDIGLVPVLVDVGVSLGLDGAGLRRALEGGRYTGRVLQAERRAAGLGISGVPAMVLAGPGGQQLVAGAQPYEAMRRMVEVVRG